MDKIIAGPTPPDSWNPLEWIFFMLRVLFWLLTANPTCDEGC
jgi:hypothetical protein